MYTLDSFVAFEKLSVFRQNASVHVYDPNLFSLVSTLVHRLVMALSSDEYTDFEGDLPQPPPRSDRMSLTGGGRSSKPPKTPKKKSEFESKGNDKEVPSAHSQPEDELVTDALTLFSDGNPKKGGRGREKNTTAEMSEPDGYRTPSGVETTTE